MKNQRELSKWAIISSLTIATSLLLLNIPTTVKADSTANVKTETSTDTTTLPAGIKGNVIASGLDGTAHYYVTDQNILYFTDGTLDKQDTWNLEVDYGAKITKIDTSLASKNSVYAPADASYLFDYQDDNNYDPSKNFTWGALTTMDLSNLNTSNVTNMVGMFAEVAHVTDLDLTNFDTAKVTYMGAMFDGMGDLKDLNLSSFDMSAIKLKDALGLGRFSQGTGSLSKITLGPKNRFSDYITLEQPSDVASIEGWENIGSGTAEHPTGSLKLSTSESLSKYYDGSGKNGVETFVPYGVKNFDPITFNQNVYLNGKKNKLSKEYDIPIVESSSVVPKDISDPVIPSDWVLDDSKTTVSVTMGGETADIPLDELKAAMGNKDLDLVNIMNFFGGRGKNYSGVNYTLNTYYTGKEPSTTTNTSSGGSTGYDDTEVPLAANIGKVATYYDQPDVTLWSLYRRGSGSVTQIKNRVLAHGSSWYVDKKVTINNVDYLRVASNEWVKASQVYPYKDFQGTIRTNDGSYKSLYTAEGKLVKTRALAADTNWKSDRTINLNGKEYYRVANNEFVKANDVSVN